MNWTSGLPKVVGISQRVKRITLQRYLLSKFVYEMDRVTIVDLCTLFENQLWLEYKVQHDLNFLKEFGQSLEDLSIILKNINFNEEFKIRALRRFRDRIKEKLSDFIYPQRNYSSVGKKLEGQYSLIEPKQPGIPKSSLPARKVIGKGYTDKGTRRDMAYDGSPKWQEVAAHHGPLYKEGVPIDENLSPAGKLLKLIQELEDLSYYWQNKHSDTLETATENLKRFIAKIRE